MAGKSGRTINNVPQSPVKKLILSWEGILVLLLVGVNIFCSQYSDVYTVANLFRQMPVYLAEVFLMFIMAFILVMGEIDISVGSTVCLAATVACIVSNAGSPFIVVVLAALAVGTLCGVLNAVILTRFTELPPMIVTLSTQIIFRGIAEIVLGSGGSVAVSNTEGFSAIMGKVKLPDFVLFGTQMKGVGIPYVFFLVVVLAVALAIVLGKSTFGRKVYAIGTNRLAARYSGIHVQKIRFVIYTVMGCFAGVSALFLMGKSFGANTTTGTGLEMNAIAMAVFGGISSTGGKGNLAGGVLSAFIIMCLRIGLSQRNVHPQVILLILGCLLIAAVALPNVIASLRRMLKK